MGRPAASKLLTDLRCRYPIGRRWSDYLGAVSVQVRVAEDARDPKEVQRLLGLIAYTLGDALRPRRKRKPGAVQYSEVYATPWLPWPKG